jgi:hypothetical protein
MLRAHPRIYISHEAFFYVANRLCPGRKSGRDFMEYYFQTWWFRWLGIDPARVLAGLPDPLPRKKVGLGFAAVMREKAALYGKPRFGDKTPGHAVCLPEIFTDFPDARVVHVVRDPRETVQSLQRMPWTPPSLVFNALYLADERNQIAKWRNRILEVRLEDLLAQPRPTMKRVLDYVGEPWDEAVLDHARSIPEESDIPQMPWHEGATRDRSAAPERREGLSPLQTRMVELIAWRTMKEAGYQRAKLAHTPNLLTVFWAMARETPSLFRSLLVGIRFVLRMRKDPAALDQMENRALVRRLNPEAWTQDGDDAFHAPPLALGREPASPTAEQLLAGAPSASRSGER